MHNTVSHDAMCSAWPSIFSVMTDSFFYILLFNTISPEKAIFMVNSVVETFKKNNENFRKNLENIQ